MGCVKKVSIRQIGQILMILSFGMLSGQTEEKTDFEYGERLFQEALYDLAVIQFEEFLKTYPDSPKRDRIRFNLAESYYKQGFYKEAGEHYVSLLIQNPESGFCAEAQYRTAECFEKTGNTSAAIRSYERVHLYYPNSPRTFIGLFKSAELSEKSGDFSQASALCKQLLETEAPRDLIIKTQFLLSDVWIHQNRPDLAISLLKKIISDNAGSEYAAAAGHELGVVYFHLGQLESAKTVWNTALTGTRNDSLKHEVSLKLASLHFQTGAPEQGINLIRQVIEQATDSSILSDSYYQLGQIEWASKHISDAENAFNNSKRFGTPERQLKATIEKLKCLNKLGDFQEAIQEARMCLTFSGISHKNRQTVLLKLAEAQHLNGHHENAIQTYIDLLESCQDKTIRALVRLKMAGLYITNLEMVSEGLFQLTQIWNGSPNGFYVPEARYLYATGLEKNRLFDEAIRVHESIRNRYVGSRWARQSQQRLVHVFERKTGIPVLSEEGELYENLGDYFANVHFDFEQAGNAYHQLENPDASLNFKIAENYKKGYILNNSVSWLDSMQSYYLRVISHPDYEVFAQITLCELLYPDQPDEKYKIYDKLLKENLKETEIDTLKLHIGRVCLELDSLDRAIGILRTCRLPQAKLPSAKALILKQKYLEAGEALKDLLKQTKNVFEKEEATYLLGSVYFHNREDSLALDTFESWISSYPYSEKRRLCERFMGELFLRNRHFEKAAAIYLTHVSEDSVQQALFSIGLDQSENEKTAETYWGLARAYEGLNQINQAKNAYFKVLFHQPTQQIREAAYEALSRISESHLHYDRAIEYQRNSKSAPDSMNLQIGLLQMKLGDYETAALSIRKTLENSSSDTLALEANRWLTIALLRQGQLPQANTRAQLIEKNYKKFPQYDNILAQILIEKGMTYQRNKNFENAMDAFETVQKKYKNTEWIPRAELEKGRVLLITNKTDDALKLLTGMPEKYADHPILDRVYLNLGDFYFRSKQYDNAIRSFKSAVDSKRDSEITPLALRFLIRVYEGMGMYDAALARTRQYIADYPEADDIIQKQIQIGLNYMHLKEYSYAIDQLSRIKTSADAESEAEIQYWIGKCYSEMGQFRRSVFEYMKVKYLSRPTKLPWASTAVFEAAKSYERLHEPQKAKKLYEKVVLAEGRTSDLGRIAQQKVDQILGIQERDGS